MLGNPEVLQFAASAPMRAEIKDIKDRLVWINEYTERLIGVRLIDIQGRRSTELWPGPTTERLHQQEVDTIVSGTGNTVVEHVTAPAPCWLRIVRVPLSERRVLCMATDITAEVQLAALRTLLAGTPVPMQHPLASEAVSLVLGGWTVSDLCAALNVGVDTAAAIVYRLARG
jgi:hypothetical protein